jgi:hypothetical protein
MFLRLSKEIEITSTFKYKKTELVKVSSWMLSCVFLCVRSCPSQEGFDPAVVKDPLYFRDDKAKTFVPVRCLVPIRHAAADKLPGVEYFSCMQLTPDLYTQIVTAKAKL